MAAGFGELAAFGTAFGWAVSSYAHGLVGRMAGAAEVTLLRLPYQMAVLGLLCLLLHVDVALPAKSAGLLFLSGLTGIACSDFMLYRAMMIIGPHLGVLLISLSAGITALFGRLFMGESLPAQAVFGIGVTMFGIAWVLRERGGGTFFPGQENPCGKVLAFGVLLGLGAALFQALSFIFWKMAMQGGSNPLWATFVRLLLASLLLWGLGLLRGWSRSALRAIRTQPGVFWTLLGASGFSAGGMWMAGVAMDRAPAGVAATIIGLQPVLITFVSAAWNRRRPSWRVLLGTAVAFAGTALVCLR